MSMKGADASGTAAPLLLLIDDVPEDLRWLNTVLGQDYRLALAYSGHQGLQRAQALRPQLILLDIGLPDMDGFALCRLLKNDPLTAAIPVLFLSAQDETHERVKGLGAGAVDFIGKPFYPEEVLARVRVHLQLAAQRGAAAAGDVSASVRDPDALLVQEAAAYIRAHLAALPPVSELAGRLGLHEKRLLALFREHLGQTISGFASEERMLTGARLLSETAMSVQDIAAAVGFSNPGNFATAFRTRHGLSPQAYRQSMRERSVLGAT
jgi:DNA-binding response OmpR family regulator